MKQIKQIIVGFLVTTPVFAFAISDFASFVNVIKSIVNLIIPVLMGLGLVYFLWGVVQYIQAGTDENKKVSAKESIAYGLIGLFVMVAVWGLVAVIINTFGLTIPTSAV